MPLTPIVSRPSPKLVTSRASVVPGGRVPREAGITDSNSASDTKQMASATAQIQLACPTCKFLLPGTLRATGGMLRCPPDHKGEFSNVA